MGVAEVGDRRSRSTTHLQTDVVLRRPRSPLSRAGALYRISDAVGDPALRAAADTLLDHGLRAVENGEYVATHWLASFAWDALLSR